MADESKKIDALTFEAAYAELEAIVDKLEKGTVPLAESIAIYARGEALKARCDALLKDAEMRVEKISVGAEGKALSTEKLNGD
jgi:exodeoxyribonuclease VII small subunit